MPLYLSSYYYIYVSSYYYVCVLAHTTRCRDVRTREVGIQEIHKSIRPESVELIRRDYVANGGWETFLSYEDPIQDILIGLLRLRKCSKQGTFRPELTQGQCSIVRELHVYGTAGFLVLQRH